VTRKVYDKLVRDRIPEIIRESGSTCATGSFGPDEFRRALREKLVQEAREAADAADGDLLTELADIAEVLDALLAAHGLTHEDVRTMQNRRRAERGGFTQRVRLLWTE